MNWEGHVRLPITIYRATSQPLFSGIAYVPIARPSKFTKLFLCTANSDLISYLYRRINTRTKVRHFTLES